MGTDERKAVGLALTAVAIGCGLPERPAPTILNATDTPLHVQAVGADAATRYDPAMTLALDPGNERILEPGSSRSLERGNIIEHHSGEGLVLFLYGVTGSDAVFLGTRPIAAGALADTIILAELPERSVQAAGGAPGAAATLPAEQAAFWSALESQCGRAFEGEVLEAPAGDTTFAGRRLVMHVRECGPAEIRIPFHVGDDRSRTWVLTRSAAGLRLKHDHRHEDGTEDEVTQYGGDTAGPGSATRQEFPADAHTASLIPAAATNVWTVELVPGERFVYALRREGTDRRFRIEFDLTRPVPPPPPPWGWEGGPA